MSEEKTTNKIRGRVVYRDPNRPSKAETKRKFLEKCRERDMFMKRCSSLNEHTMPTCHVYSPTTPQQINLPDNPCQLLDVLDGIQSVVYRCSASCKPTKKASKKINDYMQRINGLRILTFIMCGANDKDIREFIENGTMTEHLSEILNQKEEALCQ